MRRSSVVSGLLLLTAFLTDQFSKWFAAHALEVHFNRGIIMGLFAEAPASIRVTALGSFAGFIFFFYVFLVYLIPWRGRWLSFCLSLLVGGILGNVTDRTIYGHTRDFIPLSFGGFQILFNFADVFLWSGGLFVLWMVVRHDRLIWYPENIRNRYLVRPREQLKFAMHFFWIAFCCSLVLGIFSFSFVRTSVLPRGQSPDALAWSYLLTFLSLAALFGLLSFLVGIVVSHKTAGPLYAFEKYVEDLLEGEDYQLNLRDGDNYRHFEKVAEKLRRRIGQRVPQDDETGT